MLLSDESHFLLYKSDERTHVLQEVGHIFTEDLSYQCKPMIMDQFMLCVLSTMGAKLCLVLLTRDVKTFSYQLLLEEEMVPNAGKNFG